ncbi:MAG: rRNA maturation RNase YbeY [Tissierellia bacterium]|nr:rRNA maturation RNase YbeY [Tissierellia bacterium]
MRVLIDNRDDKLDNLYQEELEEVILETLKTEGVGENFEISVSFVSENEIKSLNRDYRNIDRVTDVLSFPTDLIEESEIMMPLGDIVICVKRAKEQAREYGHDLKREIMYLTCHSMLHLLGYDHIKEDDKLEMRKREKEIMKSLGVFK